MKRLVVNADDFGFTSDVNEGILRSHLEGIVRSASLMAGAPAVEHALQIAGRHPGLGVGCHLTLIQGESLADPGIQLPPSAAKLLANPPTSQEVLREFRAQVEFVIERGIRPSHLDTHQHLHLWPPVLDAVATLADEFGIAWVRKPFDAPFGMTPSLRAAMSVAIRPWQVPFEERLRRARCRTSDYFAGFVATGAMDANWLAGLLAGLPAGIGELMCHPGVCGPELLQASTKLKRSRERELEALCSPRVRQAIAENGIELLSYSDLAAGANSSGAVDSMP